MRVIRVRYNGSVFFGSLIDRHVHCLNRDLPYTDPIPLEKCAVLPPVTPTKIVCLAVNYANHAEEVKMDVPDEPVIFLKPPSTVIGSGETIILPSMSSQVDYEAELCLVIGKPAKNISEEAVPEHIFGYAVGNDVTARDIQNRERPFGRCKGFDTFGPIGPWIETEVEDPTNLRITTSVNGEVRQEGTTADMIFKPFETVSFISRIMTLNPGDVIMTGTPPGVGPMHAGDEIRIEIENVGLLINSVAADSEGERLLSAETRGVQ